ncbi:MAG: cytochrome c [Acidobacteria bacterium]|nr:cytochrome c [Acidobacteriota bacterium]
MLRLIHLLLASSILSAHETPTTKLTWNREISRLFEKRCMSCHQEGGIAPMAFQTFAQTRPWAVAIKEEVLKRTMPPWGAAKGFGEFSNDISLPQEELNQIADWAEGGAPEGDAQFRKPNFAVPIWKSPAPPKGAVTKTPAGTIVAIRAATPGKRWAESPDGSVIPLLWQLSEKQRLRQWMVYRERVKLPRGAVIRGGPVEAIVSPTPLQ